MPGGGHGLAGQRLIDAIPAFEPYRETTWDEFDGIADRLEEIAQASIVHSLTTTFLDGPRTLYRFCHASDTRALVVGEASWWTHQKPVLESIGVGRGVPRNERVHAFRSAMRDRLAVKVDWSRMTYLRTLRIPSGISIRVMTALAAPQSEKDGKRYTGGGPQYILVLSHVMTNGIYPSEPEPLVKFIARSM